MFRQRSDRASPRQHRQLSYISQFNARMEYLPGVDNVVADLFLCVDFLHLPVEIEFNELAEQQNLDDELKKIREDMNFTLSRRRIQWRRLCTAR